MLAPYRLLVGNRHSWCEVCGRHAAGMVVVVDPGAPRPARKQPPTWCVDCALNVGLLKDEASS